jgi:hypothetical protein
VLQTVHGTAMVPFGQKELAGQAAQTRFDVGVQGCCSYWPVKKRWSEPEFFNNARAQTYDTYIPGRHIALQLLQTVLDVEVHSADLKYSLGHTFVQTDQGQLEIEVPGPV